MYLEEWIGKQITVIPSEHDNFLINGRQTAEWKTVACLTEICSDKWLRTLFFLLCDQTALMVEGFWDEEMVTVQNTPRSLQQSCCRSRKQEDSNLPRGEVMGLGNSQIMKHIFLKRQLIYRPRSLPLSFPRQKMINMVTREGGYVAPKTDLPGSPKGGSELHTGNLGWGTQPYVWVVLMEIPCTNYSGSSQQLFILFKLSRDY